MESQGFETRREEHDFVIDEASVTSANEQWAGDDERFDPDYPATPPPVALFSR